MRISTLRIFIGSCVFVVTFVGLLAWSLNRKTYASLVYSLGSLRPLEGRLCDLSYAPYVPGQPAVLPAKLKETLRHSKYSIAMHGGAEGIRFNAIVNLLAQKPAQATEMLEGKNGESADPRTLSDLSAMYIERASLNEEGGDFLISAIEAAYGALRKDPHLREALFNKALSLEKAGLGQISRHAWIEYLQQDASSPWAREAKLHVQRLARCSRRSSWDSQREVLSKASIAGKSRFVAQVVNQFPDFARSYGEEELLTNWAQTESAGQAIRVSDALGIAGPIGQALAALGNDHLLQDTVAEIEAAEASGNLAKLHSLAVGLVYFKEGLTQFKLDNFEVAASTFARSIAELRQAGSRSFVWPLLYHAICDYYVANYGGALISLRELRGSIGDERDPSLAGRVLWIEGLVQFSLSNFVEAMDTHARAISLYQRAKEHVTAGYLNSLLAADLAELGEAKEAWRYRFAALSVLPDIEDPRRVYSVLQVAADVALEEKHFAVALGLYNELFLRAGSRELPVGVLAEALVRRSVLFEKIGRSEQATRDLAKARKLVWKIQDSSFRRRVTVDINMAEARIELAMHPHKSIQLLTEALEFYEATNYHVETAQALAQRARSYLALGDREAAKADLDLGISHLDRESVKSGVSIESSRYFNQIQELFEERIALELEVPSKPDRVFTYAERARVRPWMRLGAIDLTEKKVQQLLPPHVLLIEYAVLSDRLLVWGIGRERKLVIQAISSEALGRMVDSFRRSVSSGKFDKYMSISLYDILIRPVESLLDAKTRLIVVVPDRCLQGIPYAALLNSRTRRFLVEDFSLTLSSSSHRFFESSRTKAVVSQKSASVLAVDASNVSSKAFPALTKLVAAKAEVAAIASLYPESVVLSGDAATPRRFIKAAAGYDVVHFSGHSISEPFPGISALILASKGNLTGLLQAEEIGGIELTKTRLAVLAGCRTAMGSEPREGGLSLAEVFLRAGVSTVIASVWDAGDKATSSLLVSFHRELLAGHHAGEALRMAQLEAIRSVSLTSPAAWAGFEVWGGDFGFNISDSS